MGALFLLAVGGVVLFAMTQAAQAAPGREPVAGARWRGLEFSESPHQSSRGGATVDTIAIHYTAGGAAAGTVQWFKDPTALASAHFVVDRSGQIIQCVPLERAAWHAGVSEMPDGSANVNARSVGIELCNYGLSLVEKAGYTTGTLKLRNGTQVAGFWEPYGGQQIEAVAWLCRELRRDYPGVRHVVGHEEIAKPIGRKTDPGPLFPWSRVR